METLKLLLITLLSLASGFTSAQKDTGPVKEPSETIYDETGCLYTSYENLVMAGYQGWFTAMGDGADRIPSIRQRSMPAGPSL